MKRIVQAVPIVPMVPAPTSFLPRVAEEDEGRGLNGLNVWNDWNAWRNDMPFRDPDPTDPNMLVGVMLSADAEATRDMAYVFAEEFARLGYSREQLLWLFKNPYYGGAHGAYRALGEIETLSIIDECLGAWSHVKFSILDSAIGDRDCEFSEPESKIQKRPRGPKSKIGGGGGCDE
jgi:hypothetical protein